MKALHSKYPCSFCGFYTLTDPSGGSYEVCSVCFWEDDPAQNGDPSFSGGANAISLNDARLNYVKFGACDSSFSDQVRPVQIGDLPSPRITGGLEAADRISAIKRVLLGLIRSLESGHISILEGCSAIAALSFPLNEPAIEPSLRTFAVIAGEAYELPTGDTRREWAPEALKTKDAEEADYERRVRESVLAVCKELRISLESELQEP